MPHKIKPHIKDHRFYNHETEEPKGFLSYSITMFLQHKFVLKKSCPTRMASWIAQKENLAIAHHQQPVITWIGHSTFLIQCNGITILTDPIFGNASFLYKRILPPGFLPHELPNIDVILLSHNHRDHMDADSLLALRSHNAHILVPQGDKAWFDRRNFTNVAEFSWWDTRVLDHKKAQTSARYSFLPAKHWSQRGIFDRNKSLWGSWMIEINGNKIYFGGDTAYSPHFGYIAKEFPEIHLALMPIGPCEPRAWMQEVHLSAQQAGQAFLDLNAYHFIPMHWGTFPFGVDHFETPIEYLTSWWQQNGAILQDKTLHLPKIGQRLVIPKIELTAIHKNAHFESNIKSWEIL